MSSIFSCVYWGLKCNAVVMPIVCHELSTVSTCLCLVLSYALRFVSSLLSVFSDLGKGPNWSSVTKCLAFFLIFSIIQVLNTLSASSNRVKTESTLFDRNRLPDVFRSVQYSPVILIGICDEPWV